MYIYIYIDMYIYRYVYIYIYINICIFMVIIFMVIRLCMGFYIFLYKTIDSKTWASKAVLPVAASVLRRWLAFSIQRHSSRSPTWGCCCGSAQSLAGSKPVVTTDHL